MLQALIRNINTSNRIYFRNSIIALENQQIDSIQNLTNNSLIPLENDNKQPNDFNTEFHKNHIKLSAIQRFVLSTGASVAALIDPARQDMIASLGETTGHNALQKIYSKMLESEEATRILADKPRINTNTVDIESLRNLPENTFGRAYVKFLDDNQVTPDSRMEVRFVDDPELAYVMTRYRECHDLVHTVLNMPTNMLGEVAVKWIEALNTGLPMCYGAAVFGAIRLRPKQRQKYISMYLPWAIATGKRIKPLLSVYYEKRWTQDITELRKELGIIILKNT